MKHLRTSIVVTVFWTIVVGGMYPLLLTGIGALFFPQKAQGSLLVNEGKVIGSALIGQDFASDLYFHPRPSAIGYDASSSGASNKGWTSADLKKAYDQRRSDWQEANGPGDPPMDMLFASGSGLDPDISLLAAEQQVPRVSAARRLSADQTASLLSLVRRSMKGPQLSFLGEPRVNVLELNIGLDAQFPK